MLRRRGVSCALMTLALAALCYTIAFRWTEVTSGEDGLGGLARGSLGPIDLGDSRAYYALCAAIALGVLFLLLRLLRSPFGHVLAAIRENEQRARFQGYPVQRSKPAAFVIPAPVPGTAGEHSGSAHSIVSAGETLGVATKSD